jgi:signal transduction histidine kinase
MGYYKNLEGEVPSAKIITNTMKGLEVINERGAGLISFVETYRKLTRLPQPEKKPVEVKQLFDNTITLLNMEPIDENIRIKWEVNPENLEIAADKKQVSQVLINLLKNALEALKNRPGGTVLLKGEINSEGRAQISVTDNGPGIPDDLMDKIFVPFFTTKESGSGIGLSLSRQIMLLHGGSLKVESTPEKSTTVSLVF